MMRRRMMMQKKSSDWDYEWDWTSGEAPPMMTYSSFSITEDGAEIRNPNLDFNYVGDCEIEIEAKTNSTSTQPQFIILANKETKSGLKVFSSGSSNNWQTNVSGSNLDTAISKREFSKILMRYKDNSCSITFDDTVFSGPGVVNNSYLDYTGILTPSAAAYFRSIKFRRL